MLKISAVIVGTLVALAAQAQQPPPSMAAFPGVVPAFDSLDRNGDNRLSRSEAGYDRLFSAIFATSDGDGDGFVSRAEYAAAIESVTASVEEPRRAVAM
jgi:EF hand domain-containing protein